MRKWWFCVRPSQPLPFFFVCVCLLITHLWSWEIPQGRRKVRVDEQSIGFIYSAVEEKHAQQDQWHVQA